MKRQKNIENQQFVIFFLLVIYIIVIIFMPWVFIHMCILYFFAVCTEWSVCTDIEFVLFVYFELFVLDQMTSFCRHYPGNSFHFQIDSKYHLHTRSQFYSIFNLDMNCETNQSVDWVSSLFVLCVVFFFKYDQCFSYSTKCLWVLTTFALFFLTMAI